MILDVLGDGGTTDMARRVVAWISGAPTLFGIQPDDILGLAEVSDLLSRPKSLLSQWQRGSAGFPAPFRTLKCGPLFDRRHIQRWADLHPDLLGDSTEPG